MKTIIIISAILVIIGGLNWLLVGLFSFNLVSAIFGDMSVLSRLVYILVGISAIIVLLRFRTITHNGSRPA
jgi:uncharacterized membrane protein YuzA (DUF378 family)